MKKILLLALVLQLTQTVSASLSAHIWPASEYRDSTLPNTTKIYNDERLLMSCLSNNLSLKQYQKIKGRRTTLKEKIHYLLIKRRFKKPFDPKKHFNFWGFITGFLLGPVGVAIAYIITKNSNFRTWSVKGFVISLLLLFVSIIFFIGSALF